MTDLNPACMIDSRTRVGQAEDRQEKAYRQTLWNTEIGKRRYQIFPSHSSYVQAMIPEIRTLAKDHGEFLLSLEFAFTRKLVGTVLTADTDIGQRVRSLTAKEEYPALEKRIQQALVRSRKPVRTDYAPTQVLVSMTG